MLSDEDFGLLLNYLDRPWSGYRKVRKGVKKRVRRHMKAVGCRNIADYLHLLKHRPEIRAACEQCLYVTISRFFRDRRLWQVMEERLYPQMIRDFQPPLRIWSAGCACGEEPYTIAMVFSQLRGLSPPELMLLATDTQPACLERARAGRFGRSSLKEAPDALRSIYFASHKGGKQFVVRREKLPPITWRQHNLITDAPPAGPFHMIFLRNNVLTYHQGPERRDAFIRILSSLAPGGWLVVGSHEKMPAPIQGFTRDEQCPWVYQFPKPSMDSF